MPRPLDLSEEERGRLERFASLFDVQVQPADDDAPFTLRVLDKGGWRESNVPRERLHVRLLMELCAKTLRWVYFPNTRPAQRVLLDLPDSRILRLAELYQKQKRVLLQLPEDFTEEGASSAAS